MTSEVQMAVERIVRERFYSGPMAGSTERLASALIEEFGLAALSQAAPVGDGAGPMTAHEVIAEANLHAMRLRAGVKDRSREPLLGPPDDMAVSRVLLAERPDFDPKEADRLAVKITDAIRALQLPSEGLKIGGDEPYTDASVRDCPAADPRFERVAKMLEAREFIACWNGGSGHDMAGSEGFDNASDFIAWTIRQAYREGWSDREDDLILGVARLGATSSQQNSTTLPSEGEREKIARIICEGMHVATDVHRKRAVKTADRVLAQLAPLVSREPAP
jgi:hypothetical protein